MANFCYFCELVARERVAAAIEAAYAGRRDSNRVAGVSFYGCDLVLHRLACGEHRDDEPDTQCQNDDDGPTSYGVAKGISYSAGDDIHVQFLLMLPICLHDTAPDLAVA